MKGSDKFAVRLFYSYSHKDDEHQVMMETALDLLKQEGVLSSWSDKKILPGHPISPATKKAIQKSSIAVFLLSQDFIASEACREEWELAGEISSVVRVPIILSHCPWKDMEEIAKLRALPTDGTPVCSYESVDEAWQEVYEELKALIEKIRTTFTIKEEFRKKMEDTEFLSQNQIGLQDFFVFPVLGSYSDDLQEDPIEKILTSEDALLEHDHLLLHGERLSGKTALCRYLFLRFIDQSVPTLYLDLESVRAKSARERVFREAYEGQSNGDYSLWKKQKGKVIVLDNLSSDTRRHVDIALEHFDRVIVAVQTDIFDAFYRDDDHLAKFQAVKILPLTHVAQEELIRKRIELTGQQESVTHGYIDNVENRVNDIIINNRILPRYPFYVLSILQTYEGFMPKDLAISSYGHCYYVLIIAHLVKSGIAETDDEINVCMNFAEQLAFKLFTESPSLQTIDKAKFEDFKADYGKRFLQVKRSTLQRFLHPDYGIVTAKSDYGFRSPYMYYFFLGKYLARNAGKHEEIIGHMIAKSYLPSNRLALIFLIHHSNDDEVIDDILLQTMCALDDMQPCTLAVDETKVFEEIVQRIPSEILSKNSVNSEREIERKGRDQLESVEADTDELDLEDEEEEMRVVNDMYKILKNNEILGQILRTKFGSLERTKLAEVVETVADSGLRIVRLMLGSQREINEFAAYVRERHPELKTEEIKHFLTTVSFLLTMWNVEKIVCALNKPEIIPIIEDVVIKKNTPAYDLIDYFLRLDTTRELGERERDQLKSLLRKHQYSFFEKVVSIRTQGYLNTHRVIEPIEQSICSLLSIRYRARLKQLA